MPDPSNLQPEFKYFSAEVFTNVYDGVNQIKMPKSLMILGFQTIKTLQSLFGTTITFFVVKS